MKKGGLYEFAKLRTELLELQIFNIAQESLLEMVDEKAAAGSKVTDVSVHPVRVEVI